MGETAEAGEIVAALRLQPFADVLYGMLRAAPLPGAAEVLGREVVTALVRGEVGEAVRVR
ncbi:hypothetical protein [Bailinhaonella thermotolerans]|uniref:Uncharacterized protein n=1 Tax=Bailinhaonella thermotolerans TaxID=1070861 RepID=A0A3A4B4Z3_9ACTN|nr:hypothetical protein [Bailinhaonella thermotolerans]RJL33407.1 hypothetical protein D5H75_11500 [Bailinhaonella thermotolerans]